MRKKSLIGHTFVCELKIHKLFKNNTVILVTLCKLYYYNLQCNYQVVQSGVNFSTIYISVYLHCTCVLYVLNMLK